MADAEKKQYNEFIKRPSNSNLLINASLIIGFIILVMSQFVLFRMMSQQRARVASNIRDTSGNTLNSGVILTSSGSLAEPATINGQAFPAKTDIQLVSCSDDDLPYAVAAIKPAIVNIDVVSSDVGSGNKRGGTALNYDIAPSQALRANQETLGSGIIVDNRGYILTCYHIVKDYPRVYVTVFSSQRKTYKAEVVYADEAVDLAVLKIYPDSTIPVAKLGNSDLVKITDTILAIGSPFGFEHTVTVGIISDNKRSIAIEGRPYQDFFQTDAAINRGSAGGALINTEGEVVGINTAIASGSENFSGISFAVPINKARSLLFKAIQ